MPLLDEAIYLLFKLIVVLCLISLNLMELAPTMRIGPHEFYLESLRLGDVMHMWDISPYLLPTSILGSEAFSGFSTLFEHYSDPFGQHV